MSKRISLNIKTLRTRMGVSARKLSEMLDMSTTRISTYERGRSDPPLSVIEKLAEIFGVAVAALIDADLTDPDVLAQVEAGTWGITDTSRQRMEREKLLLHDKLDVTEADLQQVLDQIDALERQLAEDEFGGPIHPWLNDMLATLREVRDRHR